MAVAALTAASATGAAMAATMLGLRHRQSSNWLATNDDFRCDAARAATDVLMRRLNVIANPTSAMRAGNEHNNDQNQQQTTDVRGVVTVERLRQPTERRSVATLLACTDRCY